MKRLLLAVLFLTLGFVSTGCTTTGHFIAPPGSELVIRGRHVAVPANGKVTTLPYSWGAASGLQYQLVVNGQVAQTGKLRAKFRPVSIFWPPFGILYWPMGFNSRITYDLVHNTQR